MASLSGSLDKQVYMIQGWNDKLQFHDSTGGKVKVILSDEVSKLKKVSIYFIEVNNIRVTCPYKPQMRLGYANVFGSKKISVKIVDGLIRLKEIEVSGKKNILYLDLNPVNGVQHIFSHPPKEMTHEQAVEILKQLETIPGFKGDMAVYNRHGVGVFGVEPGIDYSFYWANPVDQKLLKVDGSYPIRLRDGSSSRASLITNECIVDFNYVYKDQKYYLNGEEAVRIPLSSVLG